MVWYDMVWFDVLAKTPGLYLVLEMRYPWFGLVWFGMIWYVLVWFDVLAKTPGLSSPRAEIPLVWFGLIWFGMVWYGMFWYGLVWFDVLAKTPGLYLVPEQRYPWFGLV